MAAAMMTVLRLSCWRYAPATRRPASWAAFLATLADRPSQYARPETGCRSSARPRRRSRCRSSRSHIIWIYALGWIPLYFGWVYTEQDRGRRRSRAARRVGLIILGLFALMQSTCIYAALLDYGAGAPYLPFGAHVLSRYHRLLVYCAPVLLMEHGAAFWLMLRHYQIERERRNLALLLIFGSALTFLVFAIGTIWPRPRSPISSRTRWPTSSR